MAKIILEVPEIPHGHGLSFKKGIADGLLDSREHQQTPHETQPLAISVGSPWEQN